MLVKTKRHFRENKKVYLAFGGGIVFTAGTIALLAKSNLTEKGAQQIIPILSWRPTSNNVMIEMVERSTPSRPVHLVGTDLYFNSLSDASRKTGHSLAMISKQVNGQIEHVGGDVFELLKSA